MTRHRIRIPLMYAVALAAAGWVMAACQPGQPVARDVAPPTAAAVASHVAPTTKPYAPLADQEALHNSHVVTDKILSGAQPEGDKSFQMLQELGVKTIVSVDGAKPDVASARRFGMRYVHLPIGYDDVTADEGRAIAKALAELPGPIYVHCHHGRHRSAAAVAVACVNNGMLQPHQAQDVLRTFGTGENYKGLWRSAREARRIDDAELARLQIQWVETAQVPALADAMVKVDGHFEHLKSIRKASWTTPSDHPDLDPAHEALQLQEHLHEIGRTTDAATRPAAYRTLLSQGETATSELRAALAAPQFDRKAAEAAFARVSASCTSCHRDFRD